MRILFALPGLHRFGRGAEIVFESIAQEIALVGEHHVTLVGSGKPRGDRAYNFIHLPAIARERFENWPTLPFLRNHFMYEELTFATRLVGLPEVGRADVTVTCSYPHVSWALRRPRRGSRPPHVFVTQNGDWPAQRIGFEWSFFSCEGLICTNPLYYERNRSRWHSALIPNGVDPSRFNPGPDCRTEFSLPADKKIVLMVSALEPGKRVLEAMRAVAMIEDVFLIIAGDGPLRAEVDALACDLLPNRFKRGTFGYEQMPNLYRSADLFLHTKIQESFGNVYVEALSSGLPIVAHDDEVSRWILEDRAVLVDTNSQDRLAQAIRLGLAEVGGQRDNASWAHQRFSWSVIARQYTDFLADVAARVSDDSGVALP